MIALVWKSARLLAAPISLIFVYLLFEGPLSVGYLVASLLAIFVVAVVATYIVFRIRTRDGSPAGWQSLNASERADRAITMAWTWRKLPR